MINKLKYHPSWFSFNPGEIASQIAINDSLGNLQRRLDSIGDFISSLDNAVSDSSIREQGMMLIGSVAGLKNLIGYIDQLRKEQAQSH